MTDQEFRNYTLAEIAADFRAAGFAVEEDGAGIVARDNTRQYELFHDDNIGSHTLYVDGVAINLDAARIALKHFYRPSERAVFRGAQALLGSIDCSRLYAHGPLTPEGAHHAKAVAEAVAEAVLTAASEAPEE